MTTVCNKTQKPLSVPLPRGKILHLGPGKTGQIASNAVEHPALKRLVDGGELEIVSEGPGHAGGLGVGGGGRAAAPGYASGRGGRRSGDR